MIGVGFTASDLLGSREAELFLKGLRHRAAVEAGSSGGGDFLSKLSCVETNFIYRLSSTNFTAMLSISHSARAISHTRCARDQRVVVMMQQELLDTVSGSTQTGGRASVVSAVHDVKVKVLGA